MENSNWNWSFHYNQKLERNLMISSKIVTEKTLNYIETLYLYANLQDFITYESTAYDWLLGEEKSNGQCIGIKDLESMYEFDKYKRMMDYVYDTLLSSAEFLGHSKGRDWYKFPNYRLGIMDYDLSKRSNQFNIEIQYSQAHMFSLKPMLEDLDLPFDGSFSQYSIKRIDVSQIVKTPIDYLTNYNYISPYRAIDRFSKNGKTETIYLGHRRSGNVFRMYNKTIELKTDNKEHPIDFSKIDLFGQYFGDIENLYTFELELHRKYIKPTFGIDTLEDLEKVYKAYREIVGKIRIYEDNDKNKIHIKNKHHNRIKNLFQFVEYKEFKRLKSKKYKPSEQFLVKKTIDMFTKYEKSLPEPLQEHQRIIVVEKILSGIFKAPDISIGLNDYEKDDFDNKIEFLRDNQDDQLFKDANRIFAPVMLQTADDVF